MQIRAATMHDVPALLRIRTSVYENHQSEEALAQLGVTRASIAALLQSDRACAWCAESDGRLVGFSMARRAERDVFALFVLPGFENRGFGTALLEAAVEWLRAQSREPIRLSTARGTRAFTFYIARRWQHVGTLDSGDAVLELRTQHPAALF